MPYRRKPQLFPTHFRIILEGQERFALDQLFEKEPHWREPLELLHAVIRKGIAAMEQGAENNYDPHRHTRTELSAAATERTTIGPRSTGPRVVERYVATPISETLRMELQSLLNDSPSLDEETLLVRLLELGINEARSAPEMLELRFADVSPVTARGRRARVRRARLRQLCARSK